MEAQDLGVDIAEGFSFLQVVLQLGAIYWCHRIARHLSLTHGWGLIWAVLMGTILLMLSSRIVVFILALWGEHPWLVYAQRYVLPTCVSIGLFIGTWLLHRWLAAAEQIRPVLVIPDPARISINAESTVLAWDREAEHLFGYTAAEAIRKPLTSLIIPPDLQQAHIDAITQFLLRGDMELRHPSYHTEAIDVHGNRFEIKLVLSVSRDHDQTIFHAQIWRARYEFYRRAPAGNRP